MTLHHLGILMTFLGALLAGISVRVKVPASASLRFAESAVLRPMETTVDAPRFWLGMTLTALGALLQW